MNTLKENPWLLVPNLTGKNMFPEEELFLRKVTCIVTSTIEVLFLFIIIEF